LVTFQKKGMFKKLNDCECGRERPYMSFKVLGVGRNMMQCVVKRALN
jgi:hypothetical protein